MQVAEQTVSTQSSSVRQHQLLGIRASAQTLLDQLQAFAVDEPMDQQATLTEYISGVQDIVQFADCTGEQVAEDVYFTKRQLQDFGVLLRDRRDAAGFSRLKLARLAKVSDSTVKFIESARHPPSRKTLIRLLAVPELRLTWEDLPHKPGGEPPGAVRPESMKELAAAELNCYITPSSEPVRMVMDLGRFLNGAGGHVEQTNAYLDHQSAAGYLAMCLQSPVTAAIRRNIPLGAVAKCIAKETGTSGLNVIALGCGDAHLEVRLVQHLAEEQTERDIRLCLFDVSQPLLSAGFKYATDTLSEGPGVFVWAMQGNFHHLPIYSQLFYTPPTAKRRRIFSMLGNTLANLDNEPRFFQHSLVDCVAGDLLLLDVQRSYGDTGDPEDLRRRDPGLSSPFSKTHAEWLEGPIRRHCTDVVRVDFSMELDTQGALPGSYALDAIATVKTTARPDRRFSMFRFKRYQIANLAQCLARLGWEQVAALPCGGSPSEVMLFAKRGHQHPVDVATDPGQTCGERR